MSISEQNAINIINVIGQIEGLFMANGKNIAYVRVSTLEQNEARQREALQPYNIDKWFIEKASGKDTQRPKLQEMLEYIREDDTVYVEEFSRLGRSTADLLATVKQIEDTGAKFISLKEKFDTHTPAGKLQMTMMAAIAEFERSMILERQREGIAIAKREGKYKGRKAVSVPNIGEYYQKYMSRQATNLVVSTIAFIAFQFFPRSIISLFGDGDELYFEFAVLFMRTYIFMVLVNGVQLLSSDFFTAIGKALKGALLALTRQTFFLIPLTLLLPLRFGIMGVLLAGPVADFSAFVLSVVLVGIEFKKQKNDM